MKRHGLHFGHVATVCAAAILVPALTAALAACGASSTSTTPSATAVVSSPTASHSWSPGASPVPAATFPAQEGRSDFEEGSYGWEFKPTVDIEVTALGFCDDGGDGLLHSHPVGIFDFDSQERIVYTYIRPESPLEGIFRWESITPVTLKAGKAYLCGSYDKPPFDPYPNHPSGLVWAPQVEYVTDYEQVPAESFVFPTQHVWYQYIAPNFKFLPVSAP